MAQQLSVCLPGQSGDIVSSISGAEGSIFLSSLTSTMQGILNFNSKELSNSISQSYDPLKLNVASYFSSQTLDLSDSSAISELKYVSNSLNYGTCSQGNFQSDSWIPHNQGTAIPCLASEPQFQADNTTCPNPFSFVGATSGCSGCLGTFSILYNMNSSL